MEKYLQTMLWHFHRHVATLCCLNVHHVSDESARALFGGTFPFSLRRGREELVSFGIVSIYHANTQYRIKSSLAGIAHL